MFRWLKSGAVLFWTDLTAATLFASLLATGVIIKWVLPHGGPQNRGAGRDGALLGLSRHEWGDIHFWIALAMAVAISVHLLSHFGWIWTALPRYLLGHRRRP